MSWGYASVGLQVRSSRLLLHILTFGTFLLDVAPELVFAISDFFALTISELYLFVVFPTLFQISICDFHVPLPFLTTVDLLLTFLYRTPESRLCCRNLAKATPTSHLPNHLSLRVTNWAIKTAPAQNTSVQNSPTTNSSRLQDRSLQLSNRIGWTLPTTTAKLERPVSRTSKKSWQDQSGSYVFLVPSTRTCANDID